MRADRLLSIMLLLQVHRRMTARELAQRLEVSERTIHRDMEALGAAGVPVIAERGSGGGWTLLEEYRTNLTGLSEIEIQAMFVGNPPRLLADLGLGRAADSALIKLLAALPTVSRRDAEYARQRIHVDGAGWHQSSETVPALPRLQEALWTDRKLALWYQRGEDAPVERVVDPLGLVAKGNLWYLIAAVDGEIRNYRVSRITDAQIHDQPCVRPADFDLARYWEQSSAEFRAHLPRFAVVLRADPAVLPRLRYAGRYSRIERVDPPDADGWVRVEMCFELEADARECMLGFGPSVEVIEPPALRDAVLRMAEQVVQFYTERAAAR